jgi:hypothetical protein
MLSMNVDIKSATASAFGALSWAPVCYLRHPDSVGTVLPGLLGVVPVAVSQCLWFQHNDAAGHYRQHVISSRLNGRRGPRADCMASSVNASTSD